MEANCYSDPGWQSLLPGDLSAYRHLSPSEICDHNDHDVHDVLFCTSPKGGLILMDGGTIKRPITTLSICLNKYPFFKVKYEGEGGRFLHGLYPYYSLRSEMRLTRSRGSPHCPAEV